VKAAHEVTKNGRKKGAIMISRKLTLAAALLAASTLTGYAQNTSNPTQAPSTGAAESPGGTARPDNPGPAAKTPAESAPPTVGENSSHPSGAPTTGATTGAMHHQDLRPGTAGNVPSTGEPASGSTDPKTPTR
jgi:hypothetical protein